MDRYVAMRNVSGDAYGHHEAANEAASAAFIWRSLSPSENNLNISVEHQGYLRLVSERLTSLAVRLHLGTGILK